MGRPLGSTNQRSLEFINHYEQLKSRFKDPVEVLFRCLNSRHVPTRVQAASILCSYRFPKLVAQRIEVEQAEQMSLSWEQPDELEAPAPIDLTELGYSVDEQ